MTFDFGLKDKPPSRTVKIWLHKGISDNFGINADRDLLREIVDALREQEFNVNLHSDSQGTALIQSIPGIENLESAERVALTIEQQGYIVERYAMKPFQTMADVPIIQSFVLI